MSSTLKETIILLNFYMGEINANNRPGTRRFMLHNIVLFCSTVCNNKNILPPTLINTTKTTMIRIRNELSVKEVNDFNINNYISMM